jgi:hypothetical protein
LSHSSKANARAQFTLFSKLWNPHLVLGLTKC